MNHQAGLAKTGLVAISRFSHDCCEPHCDPAEEYFSKYSINFVEQDVFRLSAGKREWLMDRGTVFFARPGELFRFRHLTEFPSDVCFSVSFDRGFVEDIRTVADIGDDSYRPVVNLTNRLAFIYWQLASAVSDNSSELEIETYGADLFVAASGRSAQRKLFSEKTRRSYFERIEHARRILGEEFAANHTTGSLARAAGMSPYHFSRTFTELSGIAPHRFLLKTRMEKAAEFLRDGMSVTETCFAAGFSNLSHFIRTFARWYGVPPSKFV